MKKIFWVLFLLPLFLTSCLESNLTGIEVFGDADITSVHNFVYYFNTKKTPQGDQLFEKGKITRTEVVIDNKNCTIVIGKATPAPANIAQFNPQKLVMSLNISTAATITPIEGAPTLGQEGDWTAGKANKYRVTAANGTSKVWTITVNSYVLP